MEKTTDEMTKVIDLKGGGRAWAWRVLRWSDDFRRAHFVVSSEPTEALARIREARRREQDVAAGIHEGPDLEIVLNDDDVRAAAAHAFYARTQELAISIARWENVRDPRTNEQLRFPEDLDRLGRPDGDELIAASRAAQAEGAPDPNSTGDRSSSESPTTPAASIPHGRPTSRRRG